MHFVNAYFILHNFVIIIGKCFSSLINLIKIQFTNKLSEFLLQLINFQLKQYLMHCATKFILISIFLLIFLNYARAQSFQLELKSWQFKINGEEIWRPATVPSTLTQNLLENNLTNQNPYFRDNFLKFYQYQTKDVTYRTIFNISKKFITNGTKHVLTLNGLDTHCDIYLNNAKILTSRNMYVSHRMQVEFLEKNEIRIQFNSSANYDIQAAKKFQQEQGFSLPQNFSFTRKPAYQYGWDWGPRILTVGIWKPVIVQCFTGLGSIVRARFSHSQLLQPIQSVDLVVSFDIQNNGNQNYSFNVSIINQNSNKTVAKGILKAENPYEHQQIDFRIFQNISQLLWWPWDLGNPVVLRIEIVAFDSSRNQTSKYVFLSGIRDISVKQESDTQGQSFTVSVNGKEVFIMGGNYIPPEMSMAKVPREKYEQIIKDAVFGRYNMIRVWGGGQFQDDYFYQLCDRNGIMVWHDLMYACALYSPSYLLDAQLEEQNFQNIARIDNHPSLAIWNGNNEVRIGWQEWGWKNGLNDSQKQFVQKQYSKLFQQIIPNAIKKAESKNFYWQTSPSASSNKINTMNTGDVHSWRVWGAGASIQQYESYIGRFHSEYGMQSMTQMSTIDRFTYPQDQQINNIILRLHQRHPKGDQYLPKYTFQNSGTTANIQRYVYFSQIMQAYALETAIGSLRGSRPYCMGSLYWQLNDVWPCATWSTVDYYGNYKAAHYAIRKMHTRLFMHILHSPKGQQQEQQTYLVYLVNDTPQNQRVQLQIQVMKFGGQTVFNKQFNTQIAGLSQQPIYQFNLSEINQIKTQSFVRLLVRGSNGNQYSHQYFFVKPLERQVIDPIVSYRLIVSAQGLYVEISTQNLATFVHLQRRSIDSNKYLSLKLEDNYFNMLPGSKKKILLPKQMSFEELSIKSYETQRLKEIKESRKTQLRLEENLLKQE